MAPRRRHAHHRPFLKVTEAETTADIGALADRLHKALHEAEVLGLPDVEEHVGAALDALARFGQAPEAKSIGQHEPEPVA